MVRRPIPPELSCPPHPRACILYMVLRGLGGFCSAIFIAWFRAVLDRFGSDHRVNVISCAAFDSSIHHISTVSISLTGKSRGARECNDPVVQNPAAPVVRTVSLVSTGCGECEPWHFHSTALFTTLLRLSCMPAILSPPIMVAWPVAISLIGAIPVHRAGFVARLR